jgi:hypothetical protein
MGICGGQPCFEKAERTKQSRPHQGAHQPAICMWRSDFRTYTTFITRLCSQQAEVIQNHENVKFRNIDQGGGQGYYHSIA